LGFEGGSGLMTRGLGLGFVRGLVRVRPCEGYVRCGLEGDGQADEGVVCDGGEDDVVGHFIHGRML